MTLSTIQVSLLPSVAFEHRADLPSMPALYFVLGSQRDVLYIGQTANLMTRWKSHHRALQMQGGGYRIHWTEIADEQRRITTEREAINYFQPIWNRSEVPTDDMKRVTQYIRDVARYMEVDPQDLHRQILMEWAYNRGMK